MCGIAGIVVFGPGSNSRVGTGELLAIREAMARRGPDAAGLWVSPDGRVALAIWDEPRRRLFAARDPFGIRPFYFAEARGVLRFASQVKALKAGGSLELTPDPAGRVGFFLFGYVPEPFTLYREIRALPAGH